MVDKERLEMYRHGEEYDFFPAVESFRRAFSSSDILIANLETPAAGESLGYGWERFSFNY